MWRLVMKRMLAAVLCIAALLGAGSAAFAQRDGADRSQRLDSEEFRNDIDQRRLQQSAQPTTPLSAQPAATSDSNNKHVHTKKKK
jgi:hypothetical protein